MWEKLGLVARAANENGVPAITDPWPVKDVSTLLRPMRQAPVADFCFRLFT